MSDMRPTTTSILRFENVSKIFQGQVVLDDLSLEMRQGEFLTLLGPSGCGKTTSLNLVAGLIQPDQGAVFLRGEPANTMQPRKRGLGLVFQSWALFPHLNAFDNIAYGLKIRGATDASIKSRVKAMLELVRLPGIDQKFPSQLSGGMQQRVALARALVTQPDLLLLDEPLSNLDEALRKEMQVELRRIHSELNVSTLLVTHSQEEALVLSDRIAVMRRGKIECVAAPDAVYNRPPNEFVCNFVGDGNILRCDVERVEGGEALLRHGTLQFAAVVPSGTNAGQKLKVAIRPENIILHRAVAANTMDGHIKDAIFKGSHIDYVITAGDDKLHVLALPPIDSPIFVPGEPIRFSFPKNRVIALAEDRADD
jgi:ABC-type Fe3+/spermidine/putrescine transport system ATPase subunit